MKLLKLTTCCLEDTLNLGFTKQSCFSVMSYWVVVGMGVEVLLLLPEVREENHGDCAHSDNWQDC